MLGTLGLLTGLCLGALVIYVGYKNRYRVFVKFHKDGLVSAAKDFCVLMFVTVKAIVSSSPKTVTLPVVLMRPIYYGEFQAYKLRKELSRRKDELQDLCHLLEDLEKDRETLRKKMEDTDQDSYDEWKASMDDLNQRIKKLRKLQGMLIKKVSEMDASLKEHESVAIAGRAIVFLGLDPDSATQTLESVELTDETEKIVIDEDQSEED